MIARAALEVNGMMLLEAKYPGRDPLQRRGGPVPRHYLLPHLRSDLELVAASTPRRAPRMSSFGIMPSGGCSRSPESRCIVRGASGSAPMTQWIWSPCSLRESALRPPSCALLEALCVEVRSQLCAACRRKASHDEHTPSFGGVGAVQVFDSSSALNP